MIGPKHYEGWTCKHCDYLELLTFPEGRQYKCLSKDINDEYTKRNPFIPDIEHTPNFCPYIRNRIMQRVMDNS
jgi:hypothetical protein